MTKLVLSALVIVLALGMVAGTSTAQAAPASQRVHCTGANSVWDDSDIVHLTKEGAGTLALTWRARGHTTLDCGTGSPLTGQVARIQQNVHAQVMTGGGLQGRSQVHIQVAGFSREFQGSYRGTTWVNQGTLSVMGVASDKDGDSDGADFLALRQHGTVNLAAKSFITHEIGSIVFNTSTQR